MYRNNIPNQTFLILFIKNKLKEERETEQMIKATENWQFFTFLESLWTGFV